ncbi:MAG: hypothetical protein ABIP38_00345 [Steroidobacteraceae bacterium]
MLRKADHAGGYATATILVVIAIIGSTSLWSYREALSGRTLANARLFQARAASLAGIGLQQAQARLFADPDASRLSWQRHPSEAREEEIALATRLLWTDSLPPGFSANRFIDRHHEITSIATSGLGTRVVQTMGVALLQATAGAAAPEDCPAAQPLPVRVRIGSARGTRMLAGSLLAGADPVLKIVDPDTGQVLWSAGRPAFPATQHLFDDHTRISTSVTPLDTDGDGLHDRIYAGDHTGRIWRVDLHNGNDAQGFASGSVLADLAGARGQRQLLAAPDVSLAIDGAGNSWLNIVVGTSGPSGANRLFVLRDYAARAHWTDEEHRRWSPIHEQDLHAGALAPDLAAPPGYYLDTGAAEIFTPAITIDGTVTYAIAQTPVRGPGCITRLAIGNFDVADGTSARLVDHASVAAGIPLRASLESDGQKLRRIRCTLAGVAVPQCSGFDPVRRRWWRREDAD